MGGQGHDHHAVGNPNNIQETDEDIKSKIRYIELIKFNPNLFHLEFFSIKNQYEILGGALTLSYGLTGGFLGYQYMKGKLASQRVSQNAKFLQ